jgi:hypothetical protein
MATAYPLPIPDAAEHAPQSWEEFQRECQALWDQGLRGDDLIRAIGGGPDDEAVVLRTPEELSAFLEREACARST